MTGLQETQLFKMLETMTQILIEQNIRLKELSEKLDNQNTTTKKKKNEK